MGWQPVFVLEAQRSKPLGAEWDVFRPQRRWPLWTQLDSAGPPLQLCTQSCVEQRMQISTSGSGPQQGDQAPAGP